MCDRSVERDRFCDPFYEKQRDVRSLPTSGPRRVHNEGLPSARNPLLEAHRFLRRGPVNAEGWSIPLQDLGRPYILYRRRYSTAR